MACARDFEEFINCEICFELFEDPQSLICRHVFCRKCVDKIKDATKIKCPVCKVQSQVSDIKPDYRTVFMVDSYSKNLPKAASATEEKDDLLKCEVCDEKDEKVTHKCETCELLLCEKCEAAHNSDGDEHTVKAIAAIAGEARIKMNKTLQHLKTIEDVEMKKLSNRQKELDDIRQTRDNAMKSIAEKEEILITKIKSHHDNLRKEVDMETAKCVKKSKQENNNTELSCDDLQNRQAMLKTWVQNPNDISIANIAEQIQKKLQDIENEFPKKQPPGTSADTFTVKVIEGNEYNTNGSTRLIFSRKPSTDVKVIEGDGAIGSKASDSTLSDYTSVPYRDYKEDKTFTIKGTNDSQYIRFDNMQRYNNHLYCMAEQRIHVYTEDLAPVKTTNLSSYLSPANCTALAFVSDHHLIIASKDNNNGLRIMDTDTGDIQKLCFGEFYGIAIHNHKLYAYDYKINKVLIFEQTEDNCWKRSGEIYLDYNNNNEHKAKKITSFCIENEQIYITDDTSIYHLDINGKLKRKIIQQFRNPRICSVDSKGNLFVAEPERKILTVVGADGKCGEVMLGGWTSLRNIYSAIIGDENECLWVGHYEPNKNSYLTKYTTKKIPSVVI